ncbi:MAG: hypothetical protein Q4B29_02090, partial [Candidatus Saccharibacteria bacterium]|nr:hypothetical protein [Candidatus Saccharibacteria bacterium]
MVMVRKIHKKKVLSSLLTTILFALVSVFPASAAELTQDANVTINLDINEVLSITAENVTPEDGSWNVGDINTFLRNKIVFKVASNNIAGFTASMASKDTTDLVNQAKASSKIPTLASSTTAGAFPVNRWGYSLEDSDTLNTNANYNALQTSAISLTPDTTYTTFTEEIFFGAKADVTQDSGTYANTIVFTVVTGVVTDSETPPASDPTNPTPSDPGTEDVIASNTPSQISNDDGAVETYALGGSENDSEEGSLEYTSPQGVTTTKLGSGTPLVTGLAVTAGVAAATGIFFLVAAKRKKDEEEEETELN